MSEFLIGKFIEHIKLSDSGAMMNIYSFTQRLNSQAEEFNDERVFFFDSSGDALSEDEYCSTVDIGCPLGDESNNSIVKLKIIGKNLSEGKYFLLPPEQKSSNLTMAELLKYQVGEFTLFRHARQGVLYDTSYSDSLDRLQVYTGIDIGGVSSEVLGEGERPVLGIK
ncbi:hypothetical protein GSY74_10445 [Sulfurovum sp. bin170]|uniref:hypothetical protein n=1 Tax=Sulfurovum sp. bin170 TaxID=2695268 RepID=UPI0013E0A2C1|nr:hypothetical protein [Sulfurovum sp. bin170]NEW61705.1 hypothetical protein [Sulfurovum sp. bin170]